MNIDLEFDDFLANQAINMPSEEEIGKKMAAKAESDPTAFHNWFPAVETLGVKSPKSITVDFPIKLQMALMDHDEDVVNEMMPGIISKIRAAGDKLGWPLFIKTSLFSAKHDWRRTCYFAEGLTDREILNQIGMMNDNWYMVGGPSSPKELVIREMIETNPVFEAFDGHMPITREFRFFTDDEGNTIGFQPYWPEGAIEGHVDEEANPDWRELLKVISELDNDSLNKLSERASQVVKKLNEMHGREMGFSVDFLQDKEGEWHLIDMAVANHSYKCKVGYREIELGANKPSM